MTERKKVLIVQRQEYRQRTRKSRSTVRAIWFVRGVISVSPESLLLWRGRKNVVTDGCVLCSRDLLCVFIAACSCGCTLLSCRSSFWRAFAARPLDRSPYLHRPHDLRSDPCDDTHLFAPSSWLWSDPVGHGFCYPFPAQYPTFLRVCIYTYIYVSASVLIPFIASNLTSGYVYITHSPSSTDCSSLKGAKNTHSRSRGSFKKQKWQ